MEQLVPILQLPERCLLNTSLTKAFFKRNFELAISEKTLLDDFSIVKSMEWLACVKPATANIPLYKEGLYLYEEVQVISVETSESNFDKNKQKIAELVQKHIPYPILLCIYHQTGFVLNACDKRINQNDNSRRTIEKMFFSQTIPLQHPNNPQQEFLKSLAFGQLDKTNLHTCYQGYVQRLVALQAAELSGTFAPRTHSRTQADVQRLEEIETLTTQLNALKNQLKKAPGLNERVKLNMQLNQLKNQLSQLTASLSETAAL